MTIITLTNVPDGIVIAADSRLSKITGNGLSFLSDNMEKIHNINNFGLAFHGDSDYRGKSILDIIKDFKKEINFQDTINDVEFKLKKFMQLNYIEMNTDFWLAGYKLNEQFVYHIFNNKLNWISERVNIGEKKFCSYQGGNVDLVRKLNEIITPDFEKMNLEKAIKFSEYYVETTIKGLEFNNQYSNCGGPIDILVIKSDNIYFQRHKRYISSPI